MARVNFMSSTRRDIVRRRVYQVFILEIGVLDPDPPSVVTFQKVKMLVFRWVPVANLLTNESHLFQTLRKRPETQEET